KTRCPDKRVVWVPNGVDLTAIASADEVPSSDVRSRLGIGEGDLVFAYAGILGHAQGLEVILQAAVLLRDRSDIHFLLLGDGPEKSMLRSLKFELDPIRVHFIDRMPRQELLGLMRSIDAVVVPLRKNDLFKGAIPSKIFEALAMGKPLLLGVEGEAKDLFISQGESGLAFEPENAASLAQAAIQYADNRTLVHAHGPHGQRYVRENFDRERISDRLWNALMELG
ncbi:MAG: glycosyltransferase family 4 protein, partial [Flavobacteriales bacterium]|nr:glycosyltransferase family 4 protein [Flavobacteriales bacterium]